MRGAVIAETPSESAVESSLQRSRGERVDDDRSSGATPPSGTQRGLVRYGLSVNRRSTPEEGITLSAPKRTWAWQLVAAASLFALGILVLTTDDGLETWFGWLCLCVGCINTAQAWWFGTLRLSMTSDAVTVRGLRRRTIAWQDVRTIEERRRFWMSSRAVEIAPKTGKPITALVKTSRHDDTFTQNHRLLEQWWHTQTSASADCSPAPTPR